MTPTENFNQEAEVAVKTTHKNNVVISRARFARQVKSGMFDVPEIAALAVSGATLLSVILAYFFLLLPARQEFTRREAERRNLSEQISSLEAKASETRSNANGTIDLISSVERFETNYLPLAANGNAALYARLNELIRANSLRNTAGPEYAPLEAADASRNKLTKGQSLFPGTAATVTVEGSYANLRNFINSLENTKQFLVINAVEIESTGETGGSPENSARLNQPGANPDFPDAMPNNFPGATQANPNMMQPSTGGNNASRSGALNNKRGAVSLRLQMAAYFRRSPMMEQLPTQN